MNNLDANTSTTSFVCQSIRCKSFFVLSPNLFIILYLDVCGNRENRKKEFKFTDTDDWILNKIVRGKSRG